MNQSVLLLRQVPVAPAAAEAEVRCVKAQVVDVLNQAECVVRIGDTQFNAIAGALLPTLVIGDVVVAYYAPDQQIVSIAAVLVPAGGAPLADRPVTVRSGQAITLEAGSALVKLSADGLARIVAHKIENDARDLVDIDAAEVRIN